MKDVGIKDEEILHLLLSRSQKGLSGLLDRYGLLIAYIARNTGLIDQEDISECVSDVLYAVWKRSGKYDPARSSFKTWLVMIARGCAIDYLRKNKRNNNLVPLSGINETGEGLLRSRSSALDQLLCPDLMQLLQELPPPDNEIFYRRFVLGETVEGIAGLLGMTRDGIYKRIQRGRGKLRTLLEREGYSYGG